MRSEFLAVLAGALAAVSASRAQQTDFERRVTDSIDRFLHDRCSAVVTETDAEELARFGPRAVQQLVDRWLAMLALDAPPAPNRGLPVQNRFDSAIVHAVLAVRPGGVPAVRRLLEEVRHPRWRTVVSALDVLATVGPWYPSLHDELTGLPMPTSKDVARLAPPDALPGFHVPWVASSCEANWRRLQVRAAIGVDSSNDALIDLVRDGTAAKIEFAAQLLAVRGPTAHRAAAALGDAMQRAATNRVPLEPFRGVGCSAWVHRAAADALVAVAPDDPLAIEAYRTHLSPYVYPPEVRLRAARALGRFGPSARTAVPALIAVRRSWDSDALMAAAVVALGQIGPAAKAAVPMLEELRDEVFWNDDLVANAKRALAAIQGAETPGRNGAPRRGH